MTDRIYLPIAGLGAVLLGAQGSPKNWISHIDASHSRQPLVKGERLVRLEVNAVIEQATWTVALILSKKETTVFLQTPPPEA